MKDIESFPVFYPIYENACKTYERLLKNNQHNALKLIDIFDIMLKISKNIH